MCNCKISSEILLSQLRYDDGILYWKEWRKGRKRSLEAGCKVDKRTKFIHAV